jgi:hypothetical protein
MTLISLLDLPKEILSQVIECFDTAELCRSARTCELLNTLCEKEIYCTISVVKYAYSHTGETNYDAIRGFFNAVKRRPERLSYVKEVDARLELRMDSGLHDALTLFEALPKMPRLTELCMEIVGGIQAHRHHRHLEQGLSWGCTFERGRMAIYKFFRISAEHTEPRGLHALRSLRCLKVLFPLNSLGLDTDLMAYSALQHNGITRLELRNIANAVLAPPKLPGASGAITHLTMRGCQLPQSVYQSVLESVSALEHLDIRPRRPTTYLPPGGLPNVLAIHQGTLRSLSIKANAEELLGVDFSGFNSLVDLQLCNPTWNEDAMVISHTEGLDHIPMPASLPPFLQTLVLRDFHPYNFTTLVEWMDNSFSSLKVAALPHLKVLRLEAEHLGEECPLLNSRMYMKGVSTFHINEKILALGIKYLREWGVKLCVRDNLLYGHEAHLPGHEMDYQAAVSSLNWTCQPRFEGGEDMTKCAEVDVSPKGAIEQLLILYGTIGMDN